MGGIGSRGAADWSDRRPPVPRVAGRGVADPRSVPDEHTVTEVWLPAPPAPPHAQGIVLREVPGGVAAWRSGLPAGRGTTTLQKRLSLGDGPDAPVLWLYTVRTERPTCRRPGRCRGG